MTHKLSQLAIGAVLFGGIADAASAEQITVVSWGGAYTAAQDRAFYQPFIERTGIRIQSVDYTGGLGEVRAQVESGNVQWDVFVGEVALSKLGCDEGILETLDHSRWPNAEDGTPATDDFMEGSLTDCGVGASIWSTALAYHSDGPAPETIADFFDLENYPGRRGLRRSADVNLEWALLADGVPPDEVYAELRTPEGVERAFAMLDLIKDEVVWWEAGAQAPQLLADGEVVMTSAYSSRIFSAAHDEGQPLEVLWDGQVWDIDVWMVPKGAPNLDNAMKFLEIAAEPELQASMTQFSSYGPTRRSGAAMIDVHETTGEPMEQYIPTAPQNLEGAIQSDSEFWAEHRDELFERFNSWLAAN